MNLKLYDLVAPELPLPRRRRCSRRGVALRGAGAPGAVATARARGVVRLGVVQGVHPQLAMGN